MTDNIRQHYKTIIVSKDTVDNLPPEFKDAFKDFDMEQDLFAFLIIGTQFDKIIVSIEDMKIGEEKEDGSSTMNFGYGIVDDENKTYETIVNQDPEAFKALVGEVMEDILALAAEHIVTEHEEK